MRATPGRLMRAGAGRGHESLPCRYPGGRRKAPLRPGRQRGAVGDGCSRRQAGALRKTTRGNRPPAEPGGGRRGGDGRTRRARRRPDGEAGTPCVGCCRGDRGRPLVRRLLGGRLSGRRLLGRRLLLGGCRRGRRLRSGDRSGDGRLRGRRRRRGPRCRSGRQEREWVEIPLRIGRLAHAQVDVGLVEFGRAARADRADGGALRHLGPLRNGDRAEMRQRDGETAGRVDRDDLATRWNRAGKADSAGCRRDHRRARPRADVDAAMLARRVRVRPVEGERL